MMRTASQRREHDLVGRVVLVIEPDGNELELGYDLEGNVVHAKDCDHERQIRPSVTHLQAR